MLIMENIRLALMSLKANKMRALLTMLGIIIGISSVIGIMTVGDSLTEKVNSSLGGMGLSTLTVGLNLRKDEDGNYPENYPEPQEKDFYTVEMLKNYQETFPEIVKGFAININAGAGELSAGGKHTAITVVGGTKDYLETNRKKYVAGELFSIPMMQNGSQVIIISNKAAKELYGDNVDLNAVIGNEVQASLDNKFFNYTIVGIYELDESPYEQLFGSGRSSDAYIPYKTAAKLTHTTCIQSFDVIIDATVNGADFGQKTQQFFERYYKHNPNFTAYAFSMAAAMDSISGMMNSITAAIAVIAGIALLVGGIGVMNIMLVSITERTREIGTRKALGAPNSSIRLQFVVEAVVICIIGGIIGVILGILMGKVGASLMNTECVISAKSILLSLGSSMGIGVFFGYYPANKAAKMDPIEALRYE